MYWLGVPDDFAKWIMDKGMEFKDYHISYSRPDAIRLINTFQEFLIAKQTLECEHQRDAEAQEQLCDPSHCCSEDE